MKKILVAFICILGLSTFSSAQGNLQFNQVIIENFSANIGTWTTSTVATITVPAGKVWKIEHADLWIQSSLRQTQHSEYSLFIDNILLRRHKGSTGNAHQYASRLPVWLPAGTYSVIISNEDSSVYDFVGDINAIEFNITP